MVHIYSVGIINKDKDDSKLLYPAYELSNFSFWQRSSIETLCNAVSAETVRRCKDGQSTSLEHNNVICYVGTTGNVAVAIVTDTEYPVRVISIFMNKVMHMYLNEHITDFKEILKQYQNPNDVDKIEAIKSELDDTIKICQESINRLTLRKDELTELIEKTDELLALTIDFRGGAEDLNSCCVLF